MIIQSYIGQTMGPSTMGRIGSMLVEARGKLLVLCTIVPGLNSKSLMCSIRCWIWTLDLAQRHNGPIIWAAHASKDYSQPDCDCEAGN